MAQKDSLANQDAKTTYTIETFLGLVQAETEEEVDNFVSRIRTAENGRDSQNDPSKQLEDALAQSDLVEVWKLIASIETNSIKTLKEVCTTTAEGAINKENSENICKIIENPASCERNVDELGETMKEMRKKEEERRRSWEKILSNPLYISLEWLWRNNPNFQEKGEKDEEREESIIEAALDDANYLFEKRASYEHYYSRDEYKRRAEEYETFATDIVDQVDPSASLNQLHEIMDIKGTGSLLNETSADFDQSLSLLKVAADKQRKRVCIRLDRVIFRFVIFTLCFNSSFHKL